MEYSCLIINLSENNQLAQDWQRRIGPHQFEMNVNYASSASEAEAMINSGSVITMVIFAEDFTKEIGQILRNYQAAVGCMSDFQMIVNDDPHPRLMAGVYDFGVEQFTTKERWPEDVAAMSRKAKKLIANTETTESKTYHLTQSIKTNDHQAIMRARDNMGNIGEHDYRAAYAVARASEAIGDYKTAIENFGMSNSMNDRFRPSSASYGESLMVTGQYDKALEVFKALEKSNPYDADRKAQIASLYIEKGDMKNAMRYVKDATGLDPKNEKLLEARATYYLSQGKVSEAFKILDQMSEVGAFFAAKLNELGIKLSQAGKGKSALALYNKAHRVVKGELKYKISLNAALACRRLKAYDLALKYLTRAEKEYGGTFDKSIKIRRALLKSKKKLRLAKLKRAQMGNKAS